MAKAPLAARPTSPPAGAPQLEQIVAGLTEGVILIEPDRRLVWASAVVIWARERGVDGGLIRQAQSGAKR
jgi:hypothetical protein